MIEAGDFKRGWKYIGQLQGTQAAANVGGQYLDKIITEIEKLSDSINSYAGSNQNNAVLGGFIAPPTKPCRQYLLKIKFLCVFLLTIR